MEIALSRLYQSARQGLPPGTSATVLHIGDTETAVITGTGGEPAKVLMLAIGSERTATAYFRHSPPTPLEIENAIMHVEDEITRAREMTREYPALATTDAAIRTIAERATGHIGTSRQLEIEEVEQVFSLLASHSLGRPLSIAGIPDSPAFAATLLILREFMHHLKFQTINMAN